jgi:REP element-mobilizing transposase RayT
MPRAHRYHLPGYIWHITHRCHKREFLLKFAKDKQRWLHWLYEAKKRFGLCILNYVVTSNHIHLLALDSKKDAIAKSIQLVAGRTGQEYNQRKGRKGAYWQDRYHATAVETGSHLIQCLVYIDLNMVRTGVVEHPSQWRFGGYYEIQNPKQRYTLINRQKLIEILGLADNEQLGRSHKKWVEEILKSRISRRDTKWTESIAIGSRQYVEETQTKLGTKAKRRSIVENNEAYELRESQSAYNHVFDPKKACLRQNNIYFWGSFSENTG